jgi:8-oxo-dGTP pyrophosphatase MutT (NUDIX family)
MNYIRDMRQYVGHKTIIMPCACVLIINQKGEVLVQHRADDHNWGYIGGAIEVDEAVEEAAKREMKEETGLTPLSLKFFKIYSGKKYHYVYPNLDEVSPIDTVFICDKYEGTLSLQAEEETEIRFFSLDQLPSPMREATKSVFRDYISSLGKKIPAQLK